MLFNFSLRITDTLLMPAPRSQGDYILDIRGLESSGEEDEAPQPDVRPQLSGRPWLAVHWRCCHSYSRIYRDRSGESYTGRCPVCGKRVRARVGPGGVSNRFFDAY